MLTRELEQEEITRFSVCRTSSDLDMRSGRYGGKKLAPAPAPRTLRRKLTANAHHEYLLAGMAAPTALARPIREAVRTI